MRKKELLLMIQYERQIADLNKALIEKALQLQATETHRRLDDLNGEAGRLRSMQETYMPREVFEAYQKETDKKIEGMQRLLYIGIALFLIIEAYSKFIR